PALILNIVLVAVVALATVSDLRRRRIPNLVTLPAVALGFVLNGLFFGMDGARESAQGAGLGLAMLFGLFALRWMGAGDVKLMAAIGALKGPEFVFFACLWSAVFGGAIALVGLLRARRFGLAMAHLYYSGFSTNTGGSFMTVAWRMPYAPAIALGTLLTLQGVRWIGH
ncbi:MAG: prepilin peptidase, partial [Chloroflexota bacterium]|nr:prepilin peptidase [Chloroflexota bacterium]